MHENNLKWLRDLRSTYPKNFENCSVLELASHTNDRPNARDMFGSGCYYLGVDLVDGPNVDRVCDVKHLDINTLGIYPNREVDPARHAERIMEDPEYRVKDFKFDTLVCLSLFEHDPWWKESLSHNLQFLRKGALIILCWGAEGNLPHDPQPWAIVPAQDFHDFAKTLPIKVVDAFFEEERYGVNCVGAYDVAALKT